MKKLRLSLALLLLLLGSGILWANLAHAQTFLSLTNSRQKINSSLYSVSENVDIEGTVNGDVYCAGQTITIDATVHGDVLCAGQTVNVSGHIDGSLRVIGQTVTDDAFVSHSFSAAAQTTVLGSHASVGSDLSFAGQKLTMNGRVGRDMAVRATTFDLNGTVGRTVKYGGTDLQIGKATRILGGLHYSSTQPGVIAEQAVIRGGIDHTTPVVQTQTTRQALSSWAAMFLYFFAALLFFGLMIILFVPQATKAVSEEALHHLGKTLLNGLGLFILQPIIIIILLISFVGAPLAIIVMLLAALIACLSIPVAAYYIGMLVMSKSEHAVLTMAVGMFILVLLLMLPVIGVFAAIATYFIGTGAIVVAVKRHLPKPEYRAK